MNWCFYSSNNEFTDLGWMKLKGCWPWVFYRTSATNYFVMILAIVQRMFSLVHLMKFGARGFGKYVSGFKIIFSLWFTFPI